MSLFTELRRRNVFRVGIAYAVVAWLIMQFADVVLNNIEAPGWVFQAIMLLLAIGFPLILIFAWAFEMTPEGIKKEKDVDRSQSIAPMTGRKLDRIIIGIMAVVIAFLVLDRFVLTDESVPAVTENDSQAIAVEKETVAAAETGPSVAVLPFVNMSGDKDNEYFSDGLTETLLHMLAQLPDLRVAARTSSFAFKGQNTSIDEIASTLGVAHILEGSVQKAGDRVRITAQLIRADDGFHVWSQNYDRTLDDIFAIQDEIAQDVAGALDTSLLGSNVSQIIQSVATTNLTAYESYLKGLEQQAVFSYGSLAIAENHFKQALARDPAFVDARLALVKNYLLANSTGLIDEEETRANIEPLIQKVRETQPGNRLARALEINFELRNLKPDMDREKIESMVNELRNMLSQIPTETMVRSDVANVLNFLFKQGDQAIEVLKAGLLIDPLDTELHQTLGNIYRDLERLDDALKALQRAQELAPNNPGVYSALSNLERARNNLVAALEWKRRSTEVDPQDHELAAAIANDLYKLELPEEGDRWYARVVALAPGSAVAKHVNLHRLKARGAQDQLLELARSMISDQVENRHGSFGEAVFFHQQLMMDAGRTKEAYDFLVSVRPEITDYAKMPGDLQGMIMQWSGVALMTGFESPKTREDAWLNLAANMDKAGFPWRTPGDFGVFLNLVITGDIDAAIDEYLENQLSNPMAMNLEMHEPEFELVFGAVYADPRVAARLAELGREHAQLREQVQELMLEPEWNQ